MCALAVGDLQCGLDLGTVREHGMVPTELGGEVQCRLRPVDHGDLSCCQREQ